MDGYAKIRNNFIIAKIRDIVVSVGLLWWVSICDFFMEHTLAKFPFITLIVLALTWDITSLVYSRSVVRGIYNSIIDKAKVTCERTLESYALFGSKNISKELITASWPIYSSSILYTYKNPELFPTPEEVEKVIEHLQMNVNESNYNTLSKSIHGLNQKLVKSISGLRIE